MGEALASPQLGKEAAVADAVAASELSGAVRPSVDGTEKGKGERTYERSEEAAGAWL